MNDTVMERFRTWNVHMNGIPHKCLLIALTLLLATVAVLLFPYCWPFLVALLCSMALEPFVRLCMKGLSRIHVGRRIATVLGMLILFGVVGGLLALVLGQLGREFMGLMRNVPQAITWLSEVAFPYVKELYAKYQNILPGYVLELLSNAFSILGQSLIKWAGTLSGMLTSGAWSTAMSIPNVLLSIVLTIMGTYYMTADKARIMAFFHRTFPKDVRHQSRLLKANLFKALFGQIKSQVTVSLIVMTFLSLAFAIFGVHYGLLFGVLIGIADALPVIGAGLFLIPWSLLGFATGDVATGIFMACMYLGTIVIRQVFEPRIVGKNLGLYPLATMIAMYAGYSMLGFLGLLAGPVLLNVLKVVLEADEAANAKQPVRPSNGDC
ncbi:MAG: sporulation integral membrane protein YtvI [Clostridia bacterium]